MQKQPFRTAVCFSGQLRRFDLCLPTMRWLFDILGEVSFFYYGPDNPSKLLETYPDAVVVVEKDDLSVGKHVLTEGLSAPPHWYLATGSLRNKEQLGEYLGLQWYGVKQSFDLAFDSKKQFDLMVRIRTDMFFKSANPKILEHFDKKSIIVPAKYEYLGAMCDRFAVGSVEMMSQYADFYHHLNDVTGIAERRLNTWLDTCKIPIKKVNLDFTHMRQDGKQRYINSKE